MRLLDNEVGDLHRNDTSHLECSAPVLVAAARLGDAVTPTPFKAETLPARD